MGCIAGHFGGLGGDLFGRIGAKDRVAGERHLGQIGRTVETAGVGGTDLGNHRLGQGEDLKMNMGPAAIIAAGPDGGDGGAALVIRHDDAAQAVPAGQVIQGIVAVAVGVPEVDGVTGQWFAG